jgi:hypothetical protein
VTLPKTIPFGKILRGAPALDWLRDCVAICIANIKLPLGYLFGNAGAK